MKRLIVCFIVCATLMGCGGFLADVKTIARTVTPHPYVVEEGTEAEVLASGMGIVDLYFSDAGTAWIRMDENGVIEEKNYTLTYNEIGSRGRRKSQLPPGTYIMNGAFVNDIRSGYYVRTVNMENFGWDEEKEQPRCFSFKLNAGESLYIPTMVPSFRNTETICPVLVFENPKEVVPADAPYQIWDESKI